jgi:hypothetical protein
MNNIGKKFTAVFAIAGVVMGVSPLAYAGTISITNNNSATISNAITTSAVSGGNTSRGGAGGVGGDANEVVLDNTNSSFDGDIRGGDAGRGGNGGNGGTIMTGEAIATTRVQNDINTTETHVSDSPSTEPCVEESLDTTSSVGESASSAFDSSTANAKTTSDTSTLATLDNTESAMTDVFASDTSSSAEDASTMDDSSTLSSSDSASDDGVTSEEASTLDTTESSTGSDSSSTLDTASDTGAETNADSETSTLNQVDASALNEAMTTNDSGNDASEMHDDQELHSRCVRSVAENSITVVNTNAGTADNAAAIIASSGDNLSEGGIADAGGLGGSIVITGDNTDVVGTVGSGMGGNGGHGGNGGNVTAGRADSLSDIVNISGRTITRIVRI